MRHLRFLSAAALTLIFALVGCGGGGGGGGSATSPLVSPSPSASASPDPGVMNGRVLTVYPGEGPAAGGTEVSFRTQNIEYSRFPRYRVFFGDAEATDLNRTLPSGGFIYITCKTPPGTGAVRPVVRFYDEAGNVIGSFAPVEERNRDFVYTQ